MGFDQEQVRKDLEREVERLKRQAAETESRIRAEYKRQRADWRSMPRWAQGLIVVLLIAVVGLAATVAGVR